MAVDVFKIILIKLIIIKIMFQFSLLPKQFLSCKRTENGSLKLSKDKKAMNYISHLTCCSNTTLPLVCTYLLRLDVGMEALHLEVGRQWVEGIVVQGVALR